MDITSFVGKLLEQDDVQEAMRLYVQGLPSYRVLSVLLEGRLGRPAGRATLNGWVDELGERAKSPAEVSAELRRRLGVGSSA